MSLEFSIQRYVDVQIDSQFDDQEFGIKDAIPITLNLKSFIFIKTNCIHNIIHIFQIPVKTEIKWKINGGIAYGAFKIGNGMDAEYFAQDYGDSVIFYPQLHNIKKNTNHKKIDIQLTIKQSGSSLFKEQEYKFLININIFIVKKLLRRVYKVKMFLSNIDTNNNYDDNSSNKIDNNNIVNFTDTFCISKIERKKNQLLFKSSNSCTSCNLTVIIESINHHFLIKFFKHHLITSEIIKISTENNNNNLVLVTGTKYKKHLLEGIQIQPRLFWKSNSGRLVYGSLGQSLIYYTPSESDLSKSPVKIDLYLHYDHNLTDTQQEAPSDSKTLWLLRQPPIMGG